MYQYSAVLGSFLGSEKKLENRVISSAVPVIVKTSVFNPDPVEFFLDPELFFWIRIQERILKN